MRYPPLRYSPIKSWVDVSDIFFFFCSGEGKGESEGWEGRGTIVHGKCQEGGVSPAGAGGGEGPGGCLRGIGRGGLNIFFRGRNSHQEIKSALPPQKPKIPPPKTRNFMGMGFSCRKNAFFQAPIKKWRSHFQPQNCGQKNLRTRGFF